MADFTVNKTCMCPDLKCPFCGTTYEIEWHTEYGDFLSGSHETTCDECEKKFSFEAKVEYETW
jgi:hypothetical protein